MTRLLFALLLTLAFYGSAAADDPAVLQAHPMLWKVTGRNCTIYLLGSVHVLPANVDWRDARIDRAIHDADGYFFEAALDQNAILSYVVDRGLLPSGQSLRAMLPPDSQKDLDDDLASIGASVSTVDTDRPWLASMVMTTIKVNHDGASATEGVDFKIIADAKASGKPIRYFETVDQQLALLAPANPTIELQQFEMFLKDFRTESEDLGPLFDAWAHGDLNGLARVMFMEFDKYPGMRKVMFDDRNHRWVKKLTSVLEREHGTFLVTVGAGHLVSDRGVPALLKRAGFKVEQI